MFYFHINRVHRCRTVLYLGGSFYVIKKLVLQCRTEKKCFKAVWISHWFYFKSKDCPISFVWYPKNHLYKEIVPEIFGFLVSFIPCDIGQENGNYELKVIFCNSPIYWKKTNYWGFHIEYKSFEHDNNFDDILIIIFKWKYNSFYRFRPTLKSFCYYFENRCGFQ